MNVSFDLQTTEAGLSSYTLYLTLTMSKRTPNSLYKLNAEREPEALTRTADLSPQLPSSAIKGLCSSRTPRLSSYNINGSRAVVDSEKYDCHPARPPRLYLWEPQGERRDQIPFVVL